MVHPMLTWVTLVVFPVVAVISHQSRDVASGPVRCPDVGEHFQNKYCRAEFVIKVNVKRLKLTEYGQLLEVRMKTQFKINDLFTSLSDEILNQIRFTSNRNVKEGSKYVISGRILESGGVHYLATDDCDWLQEWSTVPQRQKAFLHKGLLDHNCDCKVKSPSEAQRDGPKVQSDIYPTSMCILPDAVVHHDSSKESNLTQSSKLTRIENNDKLTSKLTHNWRLKSNNAHECFLTYAFCQKKARSKIGTSCEWSKNDQVKECLLANNRNSDTKDSLKS